MRYGIFSDVHSNLEALDAVIEAYQQEAVDKYLCIGDLVGYATDPGECIQRIKNLAQVCVAGNHDWAAINMLSLDYFHDYAKEALLWTRRFLDEASRSYLEALKLTFKNEDLTLVHATLDNPAEFHYIYDGYAAWETFRILEGAVCFAGHTHIPGVFIRDINDDVHYRQDSLIELKERNNYIINVGSVGQPRDGNPEASFCIYDSRKKIAYIKRVSYDYNKTRAKIIQTGLPEYLGNRLLIGR